MNATPFEEAIDHKTGFTGSHLRGYSKFPGNLQRQGSLISKSRQESTKVPRHTYQISEPHKWVKYPLKYVMIFGSEEEKSVDVKEAYFKKFINSHEVGVTKPF